LLQGTYTCSFDFIKDVDRTLIPQRGVPLQKLIVYQLFKKFVAFYEIRRFNEDVHNSPSLIPILSQMEPVHTLPLVPLRSNAESARDAK
jgi:hypothetical protein